MRRRIRRGLTPPPDISKYNSSKRIVRNISRPDTPPTEFQPLTTKVTIQPSTVRQDPNRPIKRPRSLRPLVEKTSSQENCHPIFSKSESSFFMPTEFLSLFNALEAQVVSPVAFP